MRTSQFTKFPSDEQLENETDVFGVRPRDLAQFRIDISRFKWKGPAMADPSLHTDGDLGMGEVKKVDSRSYKKHGINFSTSYASLRH